MENNGPIIVGLDIGTTKISVMIGRQDQFGKLEILGMGKAISGGVLRGIVANIDKTVESIKLAVEEAQQKSGTEIKEVYIGIAGQHIKSLQHRGEMVRDDIENEITITDMEKLRADKDARILELTTQAQTAKEQDDEQITDLKNTAEITSALERHLKQHLESLRNPYGFTKHSSRIY